MLIILIVQIEYTAKKNYQTLSQLIEAMVCTFMSKIERKYCLISTSYFTGLLESFILHI